MKTTRSVKHGIPRGLWERVFAVGIGKLLRHRSTSRKMGILLKEQHGADISCVAEGNVVYPRTILAM